MKRVIVLLQFVSLVCSVSAGPTIHKSAKSGELLEVKQFIDSGVDVDAIDPSSGCTPMYFAISGDLPGHRDRSSMVQLLIDEGANVNFKFSNGNSYLHEAAGWKKSTKIFETLINNGAEINLINNHQTTPLDMAIHFDYTEGVEYLISKGGKSVKTPFKTIDKAVEVGNFEIVKEWIRRGVSIDFSNKDQKSLLHLASTLVPSLEGRDRQLLISEFLIANGANLNSKDKAGDTPTHKAVIYKRGKLLELFFNKGADLNIKNDNGRTPLEIAKLFQIDEMVQLVEKLEKEKPKEIKPAELLSYRGHLVFEIVIDSQSVGKAHQVEYSTDNKTWRILELITLEKESNVYLDKSGVGQPKRFYRVKLGG